VPSDPETVLDVIEFLAGGCPAGRVTERNVLTYVAALEDEPVALLYRACVSLIRENTTGFLPAIGKIRERCRELQNPHALTADGAYEHLQRWRQHPRADGYCHLDDLDPEVLAVARTFGTHGEWTLTDPAADVTARGVQRSQFCKAWNDREQRTQRVERARELGALPGVDLGRIGNGGEADEDSRESCALGEDGVFRCRPDPTKPPPVLRMPGGGSK
jgi:hypothetical protein